MLASIQTRLQPIGRALMLPIAVLPVAALLLRLGQGDLLDVPFVAAAGGAIFAHLGLLFAIGVAVGLARESHGAAGLAGVTCFLVFTEGAKALLAVPPDVLTSAGSDSALRDMLAGAWRDAQIAKLGVPAGILSGIVSGLLYNRFHAIRLPAYLSFFGGRRFVPIAAGLAGLLGAALLGFGFPLLARGLDTLSLGVTGAGPFGLFAFGMLNRLLIITGLHHILNNLAWFVLGDFQGATGDLNRFFAGDPTAGAFMAGFFPVMMFGLPAACLAMYRASLPERRQEVAGLYSSMALTSLLTGVTEPIEFSFMFLAPLLFFIHALLTGAAMLLMDALGVRLGFGFSAGLFDYLLNYGLATRPLLLAPIGVGYFAIYYFAFSFTIRRFNLPTPGREPAAEPVRGALITAGGDRAAALLRALGDSANVKTIGACTTRLRLTLNNRDLVDTAALKALGAAGVIAVGQDGLQVVVGPEADMLADALRAAASTASTPAAHAKLPLTGSMPLPPDLLRQLGGAQAIDTAYCNDGRWLITLRGKAAALPAELADRSFVSPGGVLHVIDHGAERLPG